MFIVYLIGDNKVENVYTGFYPLFPGVSSQQFLYMWIAQQRTGR